MLRESLNQSLMVIFEDLHWIDAESQALLNLLGGSIGTAKILLLVNYRPEYRHEWGNKTYYTQLRLDPLGKETAEEMLNWLLGNGNELAALKRLIIEKTDGNPFFMEEMVQNLFEEGALTRNGEVKLTLPVSAIQIPTMVQAILASRIDRLPPDEKELLQPLAVLGKEFTLSLLEATTEKNESELQRMLSDLQLAEFIYEQPATGDIEFTFKHALTQEVAYNSILGDRRQRIHERAGAAIESLFAASVADHYMDLAHHYGRSGDALNAVHYLQLAAQEALNRSAPAEAFTSLSTALELLKKLPDTDERTRWELTLQTMLGITSLALNGMGAPETAEAYQRARELCHRISDIRHLFPVLWSLCQMNFNRGELRAAHELAEQSKICKVRPRLVIPKADPKTTSTSDSRHFRLTLGEATRR